MQVDELAKKHCAPELRTFLSEAVELAQIAGLVYTKNQKSGRKKMKSCHAVLLLLCVIHLEASQEACRLPLSREALVSFLLRHALPDVIESNLVVLNDGGFHVEEKLKSLAEVDLEFCHLIADRRSFVPREWRRAAEWIQVPGTPAQVAQEFRDVDWDTLCSNN